MSKTRRGQKDPTRAWYKRNHPSSDSVRSRRDAIRARAELDIEDVENIETEIDAQLANAYDWGRL